MTQKTTQRQTSSSSPAVPVVLFGLDDHGKPKAARFPEKQADLATKGQHAVNIAAALFRRLGRGWRSSGSPLVRDDLF